MVSPHLYPSWHRPDPIKCPVPIQGALSINALRDSFCHPLLPMPCFPWSSAFLLSLPLCLTPQGSLTQKVPNPILQASLPQIKLRTFSSDCFLSHFFLTACHKCSSVPSMDTCYPFPHLYFPSNPTTLDRKERRLEWKGNTDLYRPLPAG